MGDPNLPLAVIASRIFQGLVLVSALLQLACCNRRPDTAVPAQSATALSLPPTLAAETKYRVDLTLSGGPFTNPEQLSFGVTKPQARLELLGDGLRLGITDPAVAASSSPYNWGLWIFADGKLDEESTLQCRTGTQITMDGINYAPAIIAKSHPRPTSFPLDASILITQYGDRHGTLEAEIHGNFLTPDGKSTIKVDGTMVLPLDPAAQSAGSASR